MKFPTRGKPAEFPGESDPNREKFAVGLTPLAAPALGGLRLQHLMFAIVMCAFLLWVGIVAGAVLVTGSLVLLVACAIGLAVVFARRSSTQQESLLWALTIAAERMMPLAPAALAFADQYSGGYRWRVYLLARMLEEGKTLPEAIDEVPGLLSSESRILVKTGWSTGSLAASLRQAASLRMTRQEAWGSIMAGFTYLVAATLAMQSIVGFVMYFILPKYQAIFNDFGIELPQVTRFTIALSQRFMGLGGIPFGLLLLLEILVILLVGFRSVFMTSLDIPLIDRVFRRRHAALILRALSLSVGSGTPIETNLKILGDEYPSGWARRRLRMVATAVRHGVDWVEAMRTYGLIGGTDAAVLAAAQRAGNLEWALNETATATERRLAYRLQLLLQMLFPLLILFMGVVVGVMAVAYFLPLVTLIGRLSG